MYVQSLIYLRLWFAQDLPLASLHITIPQKTTNRYPVRSRSSPVPAHPPNHRSQNHHHAPRRNPPSPRHTSRPKQTPRSPRRHPTSPRLPREASPDAHPRPLPRNHDLLRQNIRRRVRPSPLGKRGNAPPLTFFFLKKKNRFALTDGPPLHDPLAVAATFAPDLFVDNGGERFSVRVVTEGEHRADPALNLADAEAVGQLGRTLVTEVEGDGKEGVRIPRTLDVARFWDLIDQALAAAEKVSPLPGLEADWWKTRRE